jgi:hypothetical protein
MVSWHETVVTAPAKLAENFFDRHRGPLHPE